MVVLEVAPTMANKGMLIKAWIKASIVMGHWSDQISTRQPRALIYWHDQLAAGETQEIIESFNRSLA